jgi:phospholipid/cholesterol/gamma-HCH transport system substrate-binding protein
MAGSEVEFIKQKANALVNKMDATLSSLNTILEENSANIAVTLGHVAGISSSLDDVISSQSAQLKSTLQNLNRVTRSLAASAPRLESTMGNIESFSATLNSPATKESIDNLSASLTDLSDLLDRVNSGEGTAGKLMTDQALYDSLTSASSNLALLLEDLKANPKRYVHFSLFGRKK